jgi:hypothetical protein
MPRSEVHRFERGLADFKSALRLMPEHDFVRLRAEQLSTMRGERPTTPAERLRQRAERLASTSSAVCAENLIRIDWGRESPNVSAQ